MKRIFNVLVGSLLIALAYNFLFLSYDIVPSGIYGIASLLNYVNDYDPAFFVLIVNLSFIIVATITLGFKKSKEYLLPGILIPLFMFATYFLTTIIVLEEIEIIMVVIVGSFLTGFGYSMINKVGYSVGGVDIIQDLVDELFETKSKIFSYIIEAFILLLTAKLLSFESAIYALLVICAVRYMSTRSKIGISTSKTFYIITTKEEEVKKYIIEELNHDLTVFNTKGGYTNNKSKILMTAIDTKDYYELKVGILLIDPKAFVMITDSYEVINKNIELEKKNKKD